YIIQTRIARGSGAISGHGRNARCLLTPYARGSRRRAAGASVGKKTGKYRRETGRLARATLCAFAFAVLWERNARSPTTLILQAQNFVYWEKPHENNHIAACSLRRCCFPAR